jgi:hypothetical protein
MKHFFLFFLFCGVAYGQGTLKEAKDRLNSPPITSSGSEEHHTSSDREAYRSYSPWEDISLWPMLFDLTFVLGYNLLVESSYEHYGRMHNAALNPYPYYKGKGDYTYDKQIIEDFTLFRTSISNEFSLGERIFQNNLQAKARIGSRFGVTLSYRHFLEKQRGFPTEHLDFVSLTAQYYRIRTQRMTLSWGLGAGYIGNDINQFGLSMTQDAEIFVYRPISLAYQLQYTTFTYSEIFSFAVGANYYYQRYQGGLKYQYNNLAATKFSAMMLSLGVTF